MAFNRLMINLNLILPLFYNYWYNSLRNRPYTYLYESRCISEWL